MRTKVLIRILESRFGWHLVKQEGSHKKLVKDGQVRIISERDNEEIGRPLMAKMAKQFGFRPDELNR